ncbi:MAG TPA: cysteine--tRNA ligase, partial [bacterium]|nr:cysteine--tRNA ligase [bacterium]
GLDLLKGEAAPAALSAEAQALLQERADARARKDFAASDRLRDALAGLGVLVKDGKDGQRWEMRGPR